MTNFNYLNDEFQLVYDGFTHKSVIPRMQISKDSSYNPWEITNHSLVVVSMQDLVTTSGKNRTRHYYEVVKAGGFHEYFGLNKTNSDVKFILSSIIPDKMIYGLKPEDYVEVISSTNSDYFITNDGETYINDQYGEQNILFEIDRILEYTKYVQSRTDVPLIGLIKGTKPEHIISHIHCLKKMGINQFCFHTSDFLRQHDKRTISIGKRLFQTARNHVPFLLAYGPCSRSSIKHFSSADGFITYSHFPQGKVKYVKGRQKQLRKSATFDRKLIMSNLQDICNTVKSVGLNQTTLEQWGYKPPKCISTYKWSDTAPTYIINQGCVI